MKWAVKTLCFLCVLCGARFCLSLDREAFSITNYDLNLQIEPEQHRLGVRGKITLRNDTSTPQKIAVLQISSSLDLAIDQGRREAAPVRDSALYLRHRSHRQVCRKPS